MTNNQKKTPRKRGRPLKHGGFSLLVAKGELPENRKYIRNYLIEIRHGFVEDLGPSETDLSTAQKVLIDRIIGKLGVVRCVEEHIRENSVMVGGELAPALKASYLAYNNSLRLDLVALGIENRGAERTPTLAALIEEVENDKEQD